MYVVCLWLVWSVSMCGHVGGTQTVRTVRRDCQVPIVTGQKIYQPSPQVAAAISS